MGTKSGPEILLRSVGLGYYLDIAQQISQSPELRQAVENGTIEKFIGFVDGLPKLEARIAAIGSMLDEVTSFCHIIIDRLDQIERAVSVRSSTVETGASSCDLASVRTCAGKIENDGHDQRAGRSDDPYETRRAIGYGP